MPTTPPPMPNTPPSMPTTPPPTNIIPPAIISNDNAVEKTPPGIQKQVSIAEVPQGGPTRAYGKRSEFYDDQRLSRRLSKFLFHSYRFYCQNI